MTSDVSHGELYRDIIIEHARAPRGLGRLGSPCRHARVHNTLCGDRIDLWLQLSTDRRISKICHETEGCALCIAAASMLCVRVVGARACEIASMHTKFSALVAGESDEHELGDLRAFAGLASYSSRRRCALLPWEALQSALVADIDDDAHSHAGVGMVNAAGIVKGNTDH
ncbi:MAG: Fe-S cluster assembly sulfur transfer protein SufU [Dokdonella sp.]